MAPVWLITGTSNGFGLLLVLRVLKAGHHVIATMRNKSRAGDAAKSIEEAGGKVIELDMTESQTAIAEKLQAAEKIYGKIDYLINNAGYSLVGPLEVLTEKEAEMQMRTNVFGPLFTIQALLPGMRERKSGLIVNISSVAGQNPLPATSLYAASKFALEGMSESLAIEVKDFGIEVMIVEPGAFRTNFLTGAVNNEKGLPPAYEGSPVHKMIQGFENLNGKQPGDVNKGVERMFEVVTGEGMAGSLKGKVRRLILGQDAFNRITAKVESVSNDLAAGKEVAFSTAIDA